MFDRANLCDLPAFLCGHAQNDAGATGCSVIVCPEGGTCGVAVRGGAPATRETDLLRPENMIEKVHAVVLSGGSAFGLAASTGVMEELALRHIGFSLEGICVPIVVGACLFDLLVQENTFPNAAMGRMAVRAAFEGKSRYNFLEGNVGAGCGATIGKLRGKAFAMKTGFGISGLRMKNLIVIALVALNAMGNVCDEKGRWIAGCRNSKDSFGDPLDIIKSSAEAKSSDIYENHPLCTNTTIGAVLTNAKLSKAQASKVSSIVHDAFARRIKPVHTSNDGDTVFSFASNEINACFDTTAILATEAMQQAIVRAVTQAKTAYGIPAACDITSSQRANKN